jgi:beta-lactam-binding protein with PASTA domain
VPKLTGHTVGYAARMLASAHCTLGNVQLKRSLLVKKGRIVFQGRKAGTLLAAGTRVGVTVSRGAH